MQSCVDTVILPDDKTVDEDFWQTKSDVSLMVNGAYQSMLASSLMLRLFVWGDFRSDELVQNTSITNEALTEITAANIETDNTYADWSSLYYVINNCNIVLDKAAGVMDIDPSYTEGDYLADRAQMLALRSLCYFYLVRVFRDVPYSGSAFMQSSQELNLPQSAPDSVLNCCIADLEEAAQNALAPDAYSDWRRVGWINQDGIYAILADIHLWLAAVHHDDDHYQKCVDYCDLIIASKQDQHVLRPGEVEDEDMIYPLEDGKDVYTEFYINQNAEESIFELQFDGTNNSNTGLCQAIYKYASSASYGYFYASSIFGANSGSASSSMYGTSTRLFDQYGDYRYLNAVYGHGTSSSEESYAVRKMVENAAYNFTPSSSVSGQKATNTRAYTYYAQNYIVYRLTDIMLMKAEALTELASESDTTGTSTAMLYEAFSLVQAVNTRSISESYLSNDTLRWKSWNTKELLEPLILAERLRELCFEGKRWYDLLRYNYRHVDGVDYSTTLAEQYENGATFVSNYSDMLQLMTRKYSSGASSVQAKMRTEPYLYMPVYESQIEVNPNLKQNPVYSSGDTYEKNI